LERIQDIEKSRDIEQEMNMFYVTIEIQAVIVTGLTVILSLISLYSVRKIIEQSDKNERISATHS